MSVNLIFVRYAQEARAYALALLLVTLPLGCSCAPSNSPPGLDGSALARTSALAVYAHFFAALALAGFAASLLLHRSLVPWRKAAARRA